MPGYCILIGGGEVGCGDTQAVDRRALELTGKNRPQVVFLPTAVELQAQQEDYAEAFRRAYAKLGCGPVTSPCLVSAVAAEDSAAAAAVAGADLIYLGGGETKLHYERLTGTALARAIRAAYDQGAVVAGMSAGALLLQAPRTGGADDDGACLVSAYRWGLLPPEVLVAVHADRPGSVSELRQALLDGQARYGISVPERAAVIYHPDRTWEAAGDPPITWHDQDRERKLVPGARIAVR